MKETDLNKHIQFYPFKGLGSVEFSFGEDEIINALGQPDEIDKDIISDSESVISLSYYDFGIDLFIENLDDTNILSIHSDDIIVDGKNLAYMEKYQMLKLLSTFHEKNNWEFMHEKFIDEETDEEIHYFDTIGLTIWYIEDDISDICVQHPDDM